MDVNLEMKTLWNVIRTKEPSFFSMIQEIKERILDVEDTIEEKKKTLVKENVKSKSIQTI